MTNEKIRKISIVGAGAMGAAYATVFHIIKVIENNLA